MKSLLQRSHLFPAVLAGLIATTLVLASYFLFEPQVMIAQDSDVDTFTVRQQILGEIAFVTTATDVAMTPNISGLTGGISNGTATVAVRANNPTGYNMTIRFSSSTAMNREGSGGGFISNYTPVTPGTPDLAFAIPTGTAEFAYSVFPTDADDSVALFEVNTTCNNGAGTPTAGSCWYNVPDASSTAVTIINRPDATVGSATTTLTFKVGVDANPIPALPTGFYTATATLTATEN